jgi:GTP-binding protein HflX
MTLVAAFRATLEEINEADLLLHVVDITHKNAEQQVATVMQVLGELQATGQPIVTALNKIDRLSDGAGQSGQIAGLPDTVAISALTGQGLPELLSRVEEVLTEELVDVQGLLPFQRGDLLGLLHQRGVVNREDHMPKGTRIRAKVPARLLPRFEPYLRPVDISLALD